MRPLQEHRARLNITQEELAERLRALALEDGRVVAVNSKMVSAWERGQKVPSRYYQRLLCRLYGATAAQLTFTMPEDADVRRRTFLNVLAGGLLGPLGLQLEAARRRVDVAVAAGADRDLDDWERIAHAYAYEVATVPPAQSLPNLLADFDDLVAALGAPESSERRLAHVAGQLASLTAITLVGMGQHQTARRWWRSARRAADHAGDPELAAFVRGKQAVLGLYGSYAPEQVLDLSEGAVAAAGGVACTGVMSALAARAEALGVLGRPREAEAALAEVESTFERLPRDTVRDAGSQYGFPEHRLLHTQSYVFTHLGDSRHAAPAQDRVLALYPPGAWRGPTLVRLHRAACLIKDGEVGEGARYATGVLEAVRDEQRTDGLIRTIAGHALAAVPERARNLPAVAEYRDLLAA